MRLPGLEDKALNFAKQEEKVMKGMGNLMKQAQEMQQKMRRVQEEVARA